MCTRICDEKKIILSTSVILPCPVRVFGCIQQLLQQLTHNFGVFCRRPIGITKFAPSTCLPPLVDQLIQVLMLGTILSMNLLLIRALVCPVRFWPMPLTIKIVGKICSLRLKTIIIVTKMFPFFALFVIDVSEEVTENIT